MQNKYYSIGDTVVSVGNNEQLERKLTTLLIFGYCHSAEKDLDKKIIHNDIINLIFLNIKKQLQVDINSSNKTSRAKLFMFLVFGYCHSAEKDLDKKIIHNDIINLIFLNIKEQIVVGYQQDYIIDDQQEDYIIYDAPQIFDSVPSKKRRDTLYVKTLASETPERTKALSKEIMSCLRQRLIVDYHNTYQIDDFSGTTFRFFNIFDKKEIDSDGLSGIKKCFNKSDSPHHLYEEYTFFKIPHKVSHCWNSNESIIEHNDSYALSEDPLLNRLYNNIRRFDLCKKLYALCNKHNYDFYFLKTNFEDGHGIVWDELETVDKVIIGKAILRINEDELLHASRDDCMLSHCWNLNESIIEDNDSYALSEDPLLNRLYNNIRKFDLCKKLSALCNEHMEKSKPFKTSTNKKLQQSLLTNNIFLTFNNDSVNPPKVRQFKTGII
jgi:hypothetical protein